MNKKYGVFSSSVDPEKFSMTFKGIIRAGLAISLAFAPFFNVSTGDVNGLFDSLSSFADSLDTLILAGLAVWGTLEAVVGAARKVAVALKLRN